MSLSAKARRHDRVAVPARDVAERPAAARAPEAFAPAGPDLHGSRLDTAAVLGLQRLVGNAATARIVAGARTDGHAGRPKIQRQPKKKPKPPAPVVQSLTVTNATAVTGSTDQFVTAQGAAVVTVKATVDDPAKVTPGSIKWSGGVAGATDVDRNVPTGGIGKIPVKASAGGASKKVTIHIPATPVPGANPAAPRTHTKIGKSNPGANFGLTVVTIGQQGVKRPEYDLDAHINGNKWAFRVRAIRHGFKVGVKSQGRKNVAVGAPAVKPKTIAAITTDLTPPAAGTPNGPPRAKFWSEAITEAHEQAHVDRFYTNATFWPAAMTRFETTVETASVDFNPSNKDASTGSGVIKAQKKATFNSAVDTEHNAADAAEIGGSEVAAHGVSNPMYTVLLTAVRDSVVPPAPTGAAAVAGAGGNVTVTWAATAANETNFLVQRRVGKGGFVTAGTVGKAVRTFTDAGLPAGTKVTYRVRAKGVKGESAASNQPTVTTP